MRLLACPICRTPLTRDGSAALVCEQRHQFDLAREGYVNLFPAHHRQSRSPGDDERMVGARRRFLDAGHYAPLRAELVATLTACADRIAAAVDLGCGEGYFTDALTSVATAAYGIDVSKAAIRAASRRYPSATFAVASSRRLPLVDGSFDAAVAILAPIDPDVVRVLANGGVLVRVSPGPDHLRSLRDLVYAEVRTHRRATTQLSGMEHSSERQIRFAFATDRRARTELIAMTPMLHRTGEAQRAQAMAPEHLTIEAGFWIDVFRKRN